jgi:catechol 2,3-dioxygenase-like lactoylglutathione lyase family enzyme
LQKEVYRGSAAEAITYHGLVLTEGMGSARVWGMRQALLLVLLAINMTSLQGQTTRPAITGIAFVRFYTTQPDAAEKFYGGTLGLKKVATGPTWVYAVNPTQWVEIVPSTKPPEPNIRLAAVGFTTRDAAGLEKYLLAHGVTEESPLKKGQFSVKDPEGNLVVFVQSGSNQLIAKTPPSPNAPSQRIIHAGFIVKDATKEDAFWRGLLGFHPYWHGGKTETTVDWQSSQVPDGSDWVEYMLNIPPVPSLKQAGVMEHFSLGVPHMDDVIAQLKKNGCEGSSCSNKKTGRDGKVQLNLYDPDDTRVEFMEFAPVEQPCCSPLTGKTPQVEEDK